MFSIFCAITLACSAAGGAAATNEAVDADRVYLIPVGSTVGIKLFADGVMVVALSDMNQAAKDAGLKAGDIITDVDSDSITSTKQFIECISNSDGQEVSIKYTRDGKQCCTTLTPVSDGSDYKIGAWVRDSMAGIGTVTFIDPLTGVFGALGHGINDVDTSVLIPLQRGSIMPSSVESVKMGQAGSPGQLQGAFELNRDLGTLYSNTDKGVFGVLENFENINSAQFPVAHKYEVSSGPATILANVNGVSVEEFEVDILKTDVESSDGTKNMLIQVTDPSLLEKTGGIVQGMSGSPIIQNGLFVGAVTHVLVNDPTLGYGIFLENMLQAAG